MYAGKLNLDIVVAVGNNGAIGFNNKMLWKIPLDLKYYKNMTWGKTVVMGRKTYQSINSSAAKTGRHIVVISRSMHHQSLEAAYASESFEKGLLFCINQLYCNRVVIAGGEQIYRLALPWTDDVYLTQIEADFPKADTFFPALDPHEWILLSSKSFPSDERHEYPFCFKHYRRIV